MQPIVIEASLILAPLMGVFAYMLRRAFNKLDHTMTEDEIRLLIDDKLGPINANQRNIEKELRRIDKKIDELLRIVIDEKGKR